MYFMASTIQFISVRETSQILEITEKKVLDLIDKKTLQAYHIANKFLRLKKVEVLSLRNSGDVKKEVISSPYTFSEKLQDFFYFNDFYIVSFILICVLLYIICYV